MDLKWEHQSIHGNCSRLVAVVLSWRKNGEGFFIDYHHHHHHHHFEHLMCTGREGTMGEDSRKTRSQQVEA